MLHEHIIYSDSIEWTWDVTKAQGSFLYSGDKQWLDFTSGWNVANLGWNHPEVIETVIKQATKGTYIPMWTMDESQKEYARLLASSMPQGLTAIARATGGTEANEEAIKTACAFTDRKKIIGFKDSYHGQSLRTMAIGYPERMLARLGLSSRDLIQLEFPQVALSDLIENAPRWESTKKQDNEVLQAFQEKLVAALSTHEVAAVLCEPGIITGWGNTAIAPKGFLKMLRDLTTEYETLLILDEVGTGFSRCGQLWAMQEEKIIPDIVTLAKGISNGIAAIGAMVTTEDIANATYQHTNLISTFGWTSLACAAAHQTLAIHLRDRLWEKAALDGQYILDTLRKQLRDNPYVGRIRGKGMEVGLELVLPESGLPNPQAYLDIFSYCQDHLLHISGDIASSNIQLMPPLVIERRYLDQGLEILLDGLRWLMLRK